MTTTDDQLNNQEKELLESISTSKIVLPILIGLAVVAYLIYRQFDFKAFQEIDWGLHTVFWISMSILCYVVRHFFYAWRMRIMSDKEFGWLKCMELIVMWEFASAVSPTSIGGSAVSLFLLAQEKIKAARAVSIVVYSMVLDTIYFVVSLPLLFFVFGPMVLKPGAVDFSDLGGLGSLFLGFVLFMVIYGAIFFYGLFIEPIHLQRFLYWIASRKLLRRFKGGLEKIADDIVETSLDMSTKNMSFHFQAMLSTTGAWVFRFIALNCIILALITTIPTDFWNQVLIFGRGEMMHSMTQFSPTPGGSGVIEGFFGNFFSDFIPVGLAVFVALIWRLITYYPYLILGAFVIPNWIKNLVNRRRSKNKM